MQQMKIKIQFYTILLLSGFIGVFALAVYENSFVTTPSVFDALKNALFIFVAPIYVLVSPSFPSCLPVSYAFTGIFLFGVISYCIRPKIWTGVLSVISLGLYLFRGVGHLYLD